MPCSFLRSVIAILILLAAPRVIFAESPASPSFAALQTQLIADGFDNDKISRLYGANRVKFDVKGISLFFRHNEGKLNYDQFLSPKHIKNTKNYIKTHASVFEASEKKYGVDKEVIAAIILVETKLGKIIGYRSVLNTLSTMAALKYPPTRHYFWAKITKNRRLSRKHFEKKANRKSGWAYKELTAFLTHAFREEINPHTAIGSYAGAMGICQFMPSNILAYGKDGNGDGRINLYEHADAIASIASYLKHFGWHPGIKDKKAYKAVWHYNHSNYYVNTVLNVANRLKG